MSVKVDCTDFTQYRLQPGGQSDYGAINTANVFMGLGLSGYGEQI